LRKELKIGRTTYIVNGNFKTKDMGISLSSAMLRLMEKELQNNAITANAQPENNFDEFGQNASFKHENAP